MPSICDIPLELKQQIFSELQGITVANSTKVCRDFYDTIKNNRACESLLQDIRWVDNRSMTGNEKDCYEYQSRCNELKSRTAKSHQLMRSQIH